MKTIYGVKTVTQTNPKLKTVILYMIGLSKKIVILHFAYVIFVTKNKLLQTKLIF